MGDTDIQKRVEEFRKNNVHLLPRNGLKVKRHALKSCGKLNFPSEVGETECREAYYTRIRLDMDPDVLFRFLTWTWKLPLPNVLLSIHGGANTLLLKNNVIKRLKKGLLHATISTGAWLLTGGTKSGVMKLVGEAFLEHTTKTGNLNKIVALGIATWGAIAEKEKIIEAETLKTVCRLKDITQVTKRTAPLDPNHTHFLFIDTGSKGTFGDEMKLRYNLEKHISKFNEEGATPEHVKIPIVKIIIGGGCRILDEIVRSMKDSIPVLVVDGSGRAANFISRAIELNDNTATYHEQMTDYAKKFFGSKKQSKALRLLEAMKKTEYHKMIHVFSLDDTKRTLDSVIQDILFQEFKGVKKTEMEQLVMEFDHVRLWKRPDMAEDEVFNVNMKKPLPVKKVFEIFETSLLEDRTDFVALILDHVKDLKDFFREAEYTKFIHDLYIKRMAGCTISSAGQLMCHRLLASEPSFGKCCKKFEATHEAKTAEELVKRDPKINLISINAFVKKLLKNSAITSVITKDLSDISMDLFLWAIIMNQQNMAMLFWHRGTHHICTALIASCLLKSLSGIAYSNEYMELSSAYVKNARYFETLALNVLEKLYLNERTVCQNLLVTKLHKFSTTPLAMAELMKLKKFMGHTACQTTLNDIWKGDIPSYTSTWEIFALFCCPIIVHLYMNKANRDASEQTEHSTKQKEKSGSCIRKGVCTNINKFYSAPISQFIGHLVFYMVFLVIFCLMVLTELNNGTPSTLEWITLFWELSLMLEEVMQILLKRNRSIKDQLYSWISDAWNVFDLLMYLLFVTSFILRFVLSSSDFFYARLAYTVTLGMHILRSMQFFLMSRIIGPTVIMIGKMITDILFFILLFAMFVFTFGVMYQAILFPNSRPTWQLFKDIIYYPYWQLYGELFLETIEGKEPAVCTKDPALYLNGTEARCAHSNSLNSLLLAVYLVFTNILLVNILIAVFMYTFRKIHSNSELIWKFHSFRLVQKYYYKPKLAPPLNVFYYLYVGTIRRCFCADTESDKFNKEASAREQNIMTLFENDAVDECLNVSSGVERNRYTTLMPSDDRFYSPIEDYELDSNHSHFNTFIRDVAQSLKDIRKTQDLLRQEIHSVRQMQSVKDVHQTL